MMSAYLCVGKASMLLKINKSTYWVPRAQTVFVLQSAAR